MLEPPDIIGGREPFATIDALFTVPGTEKPLAVKLQDRVFKTDRVRLAGGEMYRVTGFTVTPEWNNAITLGVTLAEQAG